MKLHHRLAPCLLCTILLTAPFAVTRAALPVIPKNVREQPSIVGSSYSMISDFSSAAATELMSDDPAAQSAAREAIIEGARGAQASSASAAYLDAYATALNQSLLPVLTNGNIRARLNAAVAIAGMADQINNTRLADAVLKLLEDESMPVTLWGVKAAAGMLPTALRTQPAIAGKLMKAIVEAQKRYPTGPVTQEAYDAFGLRFNQPGAKLDATLVPNVLPPMLDVFANRVQMSEKAIPPEPLSEQKATLFLTDQRVWAVESKEQKQRVMQLMIDLIGHAIGKLSQPSLPMDQRREMVSLVQQTAAAIRVLPQADIGSPAESATAAVKGIIEATPPAEMKSRLEALVKALQATTTFAPLQMPSMSAPSHPGASTSASQ
jgi:hypothetical protein